MSSSPLSPNLLPMRWAVIFLAAALVAMLVGVLTFAQTASWPAALLAAFAAAGATICALHQMLGK
jgi:hypothetical protein